jgi:hypothetical protein
VPTINQAEGIDKIFFTAVSTVNTKETSGTIKTLFIPRAQLSCFLSPADNVLQGICFTFKEFE